MPEKKKAPRLCNTDCRSRKPKSYGSVTRTTGADQDIHTRPSSCAPRLMTTNANALRRAACAPRRRRKLTDARLHKRTGEAHSSWHRRSSMSLAVGLLGTCNSGIVMTTVCAPALKAVLCIARMAATMESAGCIPRRSLVPANMRTRSYFRECKCSSKRRAICPVHSPTTPALTKTGLTFISFSRCDSLLE